MKCEGCDWIAPWTHNFFLRKTRKVLGTHILISMSPHHQWLPSLVHRAYFPGLAYFKLCMSWPKFGPRVLQKNPTLGQDRNCVVTTVWSGCCFVLCLMWDGGGGAGEMIEFKLFQKVFIFFQFPFHCV